MSKLKPQNLYVIKDNNLTQAQFEMSIVAYRIILLAATDKFFNIVKEDPMAKIRITALDYHDVYGRGLDTSPSYRAIKGAVDELLDAKLRFKYSKDGEKGIWTGGVNWASYAAYNNELKCLEISFSPQVIPLLGNVRRSYTYYNLRTIGMLRSLYSIRLYELLMMWRKKGKTPMVTVEYMKSYLGVPPDAYSDPKEIKNFTSQIIKGAVKEVSEKTNVDVSVELAKSGRQTIGYIFTHTNKIGELESENKGILSDVLTEELDVDDDGDPKLPF